MNKAKPKIVLPKYVMLHGSELRLRVAEKDYYRDGGYWCVNYTIKDGKIYSVSPYEDTPWLDNVELTPITKAEWRKGNRGYVPKGM